MDRSNVNILIVDDEYQVRNFWRKILRTRGFRTASAQDGIEALEMLAEGAFDICILDLVMPKMKGMDVLEKLRQRSIDVKVLVLTAHGSVPSAVEAMQKGAIHYIEKPAADIEQVLLKIDGMARQSLDSVPSESPVDGSSLPLGLRIKRFIEERFREDVSLDRICVEFGITKGYASTMFKRDTGLLMSHFLRDLRMAEAKKLLRETDLPVGEVGKRSGVPDPSYFTRMFARETGGSPTRYRQKFR